jgi:hypothetical protein
VTTTTNARVDLAPSVCRPSRFYGHCHRCRHYNTCNLSLLPEGGCANWEKP